jgi:archaellum component FlaF (FlaF/FlaG flagellin family)
LLSIRRQILVFRVSEKLAKVAIPSPSKALSRFFGARAKNRLLNSRKGLQTVTAILMLLLMLTAMIGLIAAYFNYNLSIQAQMDIEKKRAQEQIAITQIGINTQQRITNITISNTGTTEVKIRAFYREENGVTTFIVDPSTYIAQSNSKTINIASLGLTANPNALLIAATERGIKSRSVFERAIIYGQPPTGIDTSGLSVGPLLLTFDSMSWAPCKKNGDLTGGWELRWTIPTGECSWKLNLTNIDTEKRSLTINQYSGFTVSLVSSPSTTTWYLKTTQYTVDWNQTVPIIFLWDTSRTSASSAGSEQKGVNNVFLTIFGNYSDGETFAQTIPFEAVTIK